jgi:protoporphyrinogen oxidase
LSLVEHTNLMPPADYGGRHLVYLGNYLPNDHELFSLSAEQIRERYLPHLKRINPAFEPAWVTETWSFAAPFAQPIVRRGYPKRLPPHTTPLSGVFLANMGHVYPQDRGQNYSLLLGERIAARAGR